MGIKTTLCAQSLFDWFNDNPVLKAFLMTLGLCFLTNISNAQERRPDAGFKAGNSYSISDIENVNLTNGNMMLNIPIASLPSGRGTSPGYSVALNYNSKLWKAKQEQNVDGSGQDPEDSYYTRNLLEQSDQGGWHLDTGGYRLSLFNRLELEGEAPCMDYIGEHEYRRNAYMFKLELQMPDGSKKEFRPYGTGIEYGDAYGDGHFSLDPWGRRHAYSFDIDIMGGPPVCDQSIVQITTAGLNYYTTDGSRLRLFVPYQQDVAVPMMRWTLYFPDGRILENKPTDDTSVSQRLTDRNGNELFWKAATLNEMNGFKIENEAGNFIFITTSGSESKVIQPGVNGELLETKIDWKSVYVYRKHKATDAWNSPTSKLYAELYESLFVVDKITLPDQSGGLEYSFTYNGVDQSPSTGNYTDSWGELKSITLPSEARAEYAYVWDDEDSIELKAFEVLANSIASRTLTYDIQYDGGTAEVEETTIYNSIPDHCCVSVLGPDGRVSQDISLWTGPLKGHAYRTEQTGGAVTERLWVNLRPMGGSTYLEIEPFVKTEYTSVPDANGDPVFTAIKDYEYDQNGNLLEIKEYEWVAYNSVPRTSLGPFSETLLFPRPTGLPTSGLTLKRKTINTYYYATPNTLDSEQNHSNHFSNPSAPALLNLIKSTEVRDGSNNVVSRAEFYYDGGLSNPTNGNLTETRVWDSTKGAVSSPLTTGNSISTTAEYDQYGNVTKTTDAKGVETVITYGNVAGPSGNVTGLYPTKTEIAANYPTLKRTSTATYDFYTGVVTSATDEDNDVTVVTEYDDLGRPVKVRNAFDTALESWTTSEYDDVNRRVVVRSDLEAKDDGKRVATQFFDQLGRVRLSKTLEDAATQSPYNETDGIKVQTRYLTTYDSGSGDGFTYQLSSNPYRADYSYNETDATMGWTRSKTWNTGRKQEVETFSGAALPYPFVTSGGNANSTGVVTTETDANTTTVTDQAGKKRRSVTNALGQLIRVDEPDANGDLGTIASPNQPTSYAYDTLSNLTTVVQGVQTRTFTYSSLSRMLSETNPEAGTTVYEFDNNGNPTKKTDSRGVSTHLAYDALNRVTQKSYTGESGYTTPSVNYTYDEYTNAIGRLTKVSSSISETKYTEFDKMGRVLASRQTTDGEHYDFEYTYNLAGMLVEQTYPSGRKVKNVFDNNGDLSIVQSRKNVNHGYWNYAKNFTYNPWGAAISLQLGNGQWQSNQFNARSQMTAAYLGTTPNASNLLKLDFGYGTDQNNGNLLSQTITVPTVGTEQGFTAVQNYSYDSLNRLESATESISSTETWKQTFVFDRYGNRNFDEEETTTLPKSCMDGGNPVMCAADRKIFNPSVNQNNNRLNTSEDYSYDSSGNTTNDPQGRVFKYNGENKQYEVRDSQNNIIGQYFFDGNAKRVKKIVPATGEVTIFVYDSAGRLSAEYSTQLSQDPKVSYTTSDHLGSPRIKTDNNGAVISRNDYHPYGDDLYTSERTQALGYKPDDFRQKFTSYERDDETGLDFAQARYYSKNLGRFLSVDPITISRKRLVDPQQVNLYSYVRNQPLLYVDPTGEDLRIKITNIVVRRQQLYDWSTGKRVTIEARSYRMIVRNDSGTVRTFDVTRASSYGERGQYGKSQEAPPGEFTGKIRTDGRRGFRIELTGPGEKNAEISSPDTTEKRTNIQIHRNALLVEGCMTFPQADHQRFEETVNTMLQQDRDNNLGDSILVTIVPRNTRDGNGAGDIEKNDPNIREQDRPGDADGIRGRPPRKSPPLSDPEVQ